MARRHHYQRRTKETYEIDVTTFLNLMVVLVPFLLITVVFSRITIVDPKSLFSLIDSEEGTAVALLARAASSTAVAVAKLVNRMAWNTSWLFLRTAAEQAHADAPAVAAWQSRRAR